MGAVKKWNGENFLNLQIVNIHVKFKNLSINSWLAFVLSEFSPVRPLDVLVLNPKVNIGSAVSEEPSTVCN